MKNENCRVTATVYDTQDEKVRVSIPLSLFKAPARREINTGIKLCGWHRGRKWGVVYTYNIWTRSDGTVYGDEFTAYRLDIESDREAFDRFCDEYNSTYYKF